VDVTESRVVRLTIIPFLINERTANSLRMRGERPHPKLNYCPNVEAAMFDRDRRLFHEPKPLHIEAYYV